MESVLALLTVFIPVYFVIVLLFSVVVLAFTIWMIVDCLQRDPALLPNRDVWVTALILGYFFGSGLIVSTVYYFVIKRK